MYPLLEINLKKLKENASFIVKQCQQNNINVFLVGKVLAGDKYLISELAPLGFTHLADSRLENLKMFQDINLPKVLLRLPMLSETKEVVKYADLSLNSELKTIISLDDEAKKQNKIHKIILMFDLGDLREGIFYKDDYLDFVQKVINLKNLKLSGVGTNLTCYGGVIPTKEKLNELVNIKNNIEAKFQVKLEYVSGGNSSSLYLLSEEGIMEEVNNLRLGESIFLGRETAYGNSIFGMHQDCFRLQTELIEAKSKPSYPIGKIGMDSFGQIPEIEDRGLMKRGILAIGKQDVDYRNLVPLEDIEIIGASSDHLLVDLKRDYEIGTIFNFTINYPGLLQLMTSPYVKKIYI